MLVVPLLCSLTRTGISPNQKHWKLSLLSLWEHYAVLYSHDLNLPNCVNINIASIAFINRGDVQVPWGGHVPMGHPMSHVPCPMSHWDVPIFFSVPTKNGDGGTSMSHVPCPTGTSHVPVGVPCPTTLGTSMSQWDGTSPQMVHSTASTSLHVFSHISQVLFQRQSYAMY